MTSPRYLGPTGAPAMPVPEPDGSFGVVFPVEPEGFSLKLADFDRSMFNQMLSLVREGLDLEQLTSETLVKIADTTGQLHEVTVQRFREIMLSYGFFYKGLWDTYATPAPTPEPEPV
jgi:hypothetical protein